MATLHQPGHDRGLGRYTSGLRDALSQMPDLNVVEYRGGRASTTHRFSEWTAIPDRARFVHRHGGRYHATTPYNLDPFHLATSGVTVHDLVPLDMPAYQQTGAKAAIVHRWAARCGAIVTPSSYTAERMATRFNLAAADLFVAPLPVRFATPTTAGMCTGCTPVPIGELPPYVVSAMDLRTPDARKRWNWVIGAARPLKRSGTLLVVYGGGTEQLDAENVLGVGRVCDEHMRQLLAGAHCFLYATAYEGQGLPPQESLLAGTPVVAFRNTSLPEMLGPGALWLEESGSPWRDCASASVDDPQVNLIAEAAQHLVDDASARQALASAGAAHIREFSDARFQTVVRRLYEKLLNA